MGRDHASNNDHVHYYLFSSSFQWALQSLKIDRLSLVPASDHSCRLIFLSLPPLTPKTLLDDHLNMAPAAVSPLEAEDHARDAAFNKALHGKSANSRGGLTALRNKDEAAQKAAVEEYFKHWDNKTAAEETEEIRKARREEYASLTRQYVVCS